MIRGFNLSDDDYDLLTEYAHANRLSAAAALRYLIRTNCSLDGPPHSGIILDDDLRTTVANLVKAMYRSGRPSGEETSKVVNRLIRLGIEARKKSR